MPSGKPAGVRCVQLSPENRCLLFGLPERPRVCVGLRARRDMCGWSTAEALRALEALENATLPE
jgi:hypothetical protein